MNEARATQSPDDFIEDGHPEPLGLAPEPVEVRRNAGLAALVGGLASAVAIAYLARATGTGSALDWGLFAVMGALGVSHLVAFVDARTPLLVADVQGVRIRLGRSWRGMPWGALARVEHLPRRGRLRDGRLVLVARNPERVLEELDASGRRQSRLAQKLYGAPFAVPLALSTRVTGAGADLTAALTGLAGDSGLVVEVAGSEGRILIEEEPAEEIVEDLAGPDTEPDARPDVQPSHGADTQADHGTDHGPARRWHDPRPAIAMVIGALATRMQRRGDGVTAADPETPPADEPTPTVPLVASATPSPLREPVTAARAEVRSDLPQVQTALADDEGAQPGRGGLAATRQLRRPGSVNLVEDTMVWGDRVRPISRAGSSVDPIVIDDFEVEPAEDPVIGPEFTAARTRLGLSVDQLAERTRIRPHVIESIEVDDFAPCGGDFYARGHLRTLARILGIDVTPLLNAYDERYADAPINPRRVFEAELATGAHGSIRGTRGGPNWSVLIAAVMTLVLVWSIARLVMDSPPELQQQAPVLNGSGSPDNRFQPVGAPVPVVLSAVGGGAHVTVLDGAGHQAFSGDLAYGESRTIKGVSTPVQVQSSDGSLEVTVAGKARGALGSEGRPAKSVFPAR